MTTFILQLIAMVTMTVDHVGYILCDNAIAMRCIGRFAFPIYAFLLAEGFRHYRNDSDRVNDHLGWIIFLTIISEFTYDFMTGSMDSVNSMVTAQSAMFTLLGGLLGLIAIERWKDRPLFMWSALILTAMADFFLLANYKFAGVLLIYGFYFYQNRMEGKGYFERLIWLLCIMAVYIPVYHWSRWGFCSPAELAGTLDADTVKWYVMHPLIAMILAGYKGERGYHSKTFTLVFKYYYAAHMLIVGLLGFLR